MKGKEKEAVFYNCPFCEKEHELEVVHYSEEAIVKGEKVNYWKTVYYCPIEDEEFAPSKIMDQNLLRAKDAYRNAHNLLLSGEIRQIRERYGLTQREYARLLGVGDATIQRYETKAIQDPTYDMLMRMTQENPSYCLQMLQKNRNLFEDKRFEEIRNIIIGEIKRNGEDYFLESSIRAQYVEFDKECPENGYRLLDVEKIKSVMLFLATFVESLYKVKLMKLFWYVDEEFFKRYGRSITGMVYKHLPLGAVPLAYNDIIRLSCVQVAETDFDDYTAYKILPNKELDVRMFSSEELEVLQKVAAKFSNFKAKEIVQYMHDEKAYQNTENNQIIKFNEENLIRDI